MGYVAVAKYSETAGRRKDLRGRADALGDRLGADGIDCGQSIGEHRREDADHLPIAVVDAGELAPHALHRGRQYPVLEGSTVAQGAGLAGEDRDAGAMRDFGRRTDQAA